VVAPCAPELEIGNLLLEVELGLTLRGSAESVELGVLLNGPDDMLDVVAVKASLLLLLEDVLGRGVRVELDPTFGVVVGVMLVDTGLAAVVNDDCATVDVLVDSALVLAVAGLVLVFTLTEVAKLGPCVVDVVKDI
jgi:hypothetical protein